ncbi:MAG: lipopolysaccharide biosynthesis protein [Actinomycetota bacterium]
MKDVDSSPSGESTPVDSEATRTPLPEGTLAVGGGLLVAGLSSYAFFKVGQEALGKDDFKPIVALWFATFVLAPGFFLPLEQEMGRALAHRRALGQGGRPVVSRIVPLGVAIAGVIVAFLAGLNSFATKEFFEGYGLVTAALIVAFLSYAPTHLARGICSGQGRFAAYGLVMGADGFVRVAGAIIMWQAGVENVGAYALLVALSPLSGVFIVWLTGGLHTEPGPPAQWSEVTPNLGWLLLGSLMGAGLVNAGPIAIDIFADASESEKVTRFGNGVLLSRVPLFLFQAVQAALLPRLARLAAQGDLTEFKRGFRQLMIVVIGVGILGTFGSFALGPPVLDLVYDGGLDRRTLTLLALGSAIYMIALATAQAVIALHGHAVVGLGWLVGMVTFLLGAAFSADDLYLRVEIGLVGSSVAALCVFATALRKLLDSGATVDLDSLSDALSDRPLES